MSNTKFTAGPWILIDGDNHESEKAITTHDRNARSMGRICELDIYFAGWHGVEQEANANLIAAAPELYDELDGLIDALAQTPELNLGSWGIDIDSARSVLKKARGEK